ncbi:hypothetical protein Kpol_483p6 [Vanderwaltozyma polyspora DSM 70294]|uniref:Transcription factor MBP1 n=1 Tax=Vanderwaltozyma polyspora (strain ATCC 22028 / DSM 70294 / BCRC 21397 / CBS 2163 / NBRC 10782 / NRRL Y-8283 / UCD 57-17) TaxID=436907 RepID=A7TQ58_VANPO|nr:uncharacterized protein Kpol_483p6 [Vanderwaltozyma polyspora DSM 70294]EDO15587.1 hypothetical protein Kpol_483p6 [Vanderwaltozyma polyspora DSM 70294]
MTDNIYSAKYSGVDVYEFIHPTGSVMKRKLDNWVNATHILKAANFAKAKRTRILEKEVIKETHEKVQGGFGKYQGTWVPLDIARKLAEKFGVHEELRILFDWTQTDGSASPPPAPKHHHASRSDSTRKKATKSNSTSAVLEKSKRQNSDIGKASPVVPKKRGRPPLAGSAAKRKLEASLKRSQSDIGFPRPSIPNSSILTNQLPSILTNKLESLDEESQRDSPISLSQQTQFKELDLNDGLSSDVEQHQYPLETNAFEDVNDFQQNNDEQKPSIIDNKQYAITQTNPYEASSPTASTPTLPTSPADLSDTAPFDHRYAIGTSPVISTIPRYPPAQARPETSDINDKVNQYLSKLVDYFTSSEMKSNNEIPIELLNPPQNSAPYIDAPIDPELHTAFHWACSMGNQMIVEVLNNVGTSIRSTNSQGQTPLMRSVMFHNCYTRRSFPGIFQLLRDTVFDVDNSHQTIIHHIVKRKSTTPSAVYYLDLVLSQIKDYSPQYKIEMFLNTQDSNGDTALTIAAKNGDKVFFNKLTCNGAMGNIVNKQGTTANELMNEHFEASKVRSQSNSNDLVGAYFDSQGDFGKPIENSGIMKSKTAEEITKKIPEIVEKLQKLAEEYDKKTLQNESDVKALEKTLFSLTKSIKNVSVRTAEVLKISNTNEINDTIEKKTILSKELKLGIESDRKKLQSLYEREQLMRIENYLKNNALGKENEKEEKEDEEVLRSLRQELQDIESMHRKTIEEIIKQIQDNGKVHKYRKMISEGTGIDTNEVDNCLDVILQTLKNEASVQEK